MASLHRDVARVLRNRREQLAPAHAAGIADDVDARNARALHDVIADAGGLHARHLADVVAQPARDAELVVAVFVEEFQYARLQRLHHAATTTPDVRQRANGLRADSVPRL